MGLKRTSRSPHRALREGYEEVVCRLCLKVRKLITWGHLVHKHGYPPDNTFARYRARFPDAPITSFKIIKKRKKTQKAWFDQKGRKWTLKTVRAAIRRRAAQGKPLNVAAFIHEDQDLRGAGVYVYGSWRRAIEAAGYKYENVRRTQPWSKARVLKELKQLAREGVPTHARSAARHKPGLRTMAHQLFGSWKKAIVAAGLTYQNMRTHRLWTREHVCEVLRKRHRAGKRVSVTALNPHHSALVARAYEYYGSWAKTLRAAGLR